MRRSTAWLLASSLCVVGPSSCAEGPDSADSAMSVPPTAGGSGPGAADPEGIPAYALALVNPRVYTVIVYASAGAAEVLVDTVAAGDSAQVELRVGSGPLKLRAVDLDGNELGTEFIDLPDPAPSSPDSAAPLRWELRRSP